MIGLDLGVVAQSGGLSYTAPTYNAATTTDSFPDNGVNVPITPPSHVSGDAIVVMVLSGISSASPSFSIVESGWTPLVNSAMNDGYLVKIYWKIAASSSETFTITNTSGDGESFGLGAWVISNVSDTEITLGTEVASSTVPMPTHTPSQGSSKTRLWISGGACIGSTGLTFNMDASEGWTGTVSVRPYKTNLFGFFRYKLETNSSLSPNDATCSSAFGNLPYVGHLEGVTA